MRERERFLRLFGGPSFWALVDKVERERQYMEMVARNNEGREQYHRWERNRHIKQYSWRRMEAEMKEAAA